MPELYTLILAETDQYDYTAVRKYAFPDFYNGDPSDEKRYIKNVLHCFEQAVNQVSGKVFGKGGSHELFLFNEPEVMEGGIETLYYDRTLGTLPQDVIEAVRILVHDFYATRVCEGIEGASRDDAKRVDYSKISLLGENVPAPKVLTIGDRVYDRSGKELFFGGLLSEQEEDLGTTPQRSWNTGETVRGPEENFVPADLVDAFIKRTGEGIEAYPAPNEYHRRGLRWFARFRTGRKYEQFAATKKEAIFQVALAQQFNTFWK